MYDVSSFFSFYVLLLRLKLEGGEGCKKNLWRQTKNWLGNWKTKHLKITLLLRIACDVIEWKKWKLEYANIFNFYTKLEWNVKHDFKVHWNTWVTQNKRYLNFSHSRKKWNIKHWLFSYIVSNEICTFTNNSRYSFGNPLEQSHSRYHSASYTLKMNYDVMCWWIRAYDLFVICLVVITFQGNIHWTWIYWT